ncbi:hypothetical protein [Qipengyuania qiaonensis]|uniref:DUF3035 domain-containing protein n=1 Tax=Qipengyuania qiaonensis TaxID=2867240 RepID=A0ABS7J1G2_9SPHN|nr:hypothetical protein [Qipengyuania qiaonensis]MBX7481179.1 hypothetical protein [Qipengyuania qiaonensis]
MKKLLYVVLPLALAACSSEPAEQESADDFANRIGQNGKEVDPSRPDPDAPNTASETPPKGADLTQLAKLGDIGGVNLGPREGGCTLMIGSQEMLIAAGMKDGAIPGKAVVRVGDSLTTIDADVGGLDAIKTGTTFSGEGFTVSVAPAAGDQQRRPANVTVRDAAGKSQSYSGNWICG